MSGQISAAWNIFGSLPGILALILGGFLSDVMERRSAADAAHLLFFLGAAIMALVALYGLAFHPDFARNRYVYLCYVLNSSPTGRPSAVKRS